jgi:dienelactone hydrolase
MSNEVKISAGRAALPADLVVPDGASSIVLFVHGCGSSRRSPRNRHVAQVLHARKIATLLVDLITPEEEAAEAAHEPRPIDVDSLASRVVRVTEWLRKQEQTARLGIGYFGASTGAAAALVAAAHHPDDVTAVVCRGGRPDLAVGALPRVRAATLMIVGGLDYPVIQLNQQALVHLRCEKRLEIIPGAGHLFEQEGALEHVANLTTAWFEEHLVLAGERLPLVTA